MIQSSKIKNNKRWNLNLPMQLLATLPILAWYEISFPVGLGYVLLLFFSTFAIINKRFKINVFPVTFWTVYAYICFTWMERHNFALWTLFPPGGWQFFMFFMALIWGVLEFNLKSLQKYMRWVVLVSAGLFWIQIALMVMYGSNKVCFVPNLTGSFTYENMSYSDIVAIHLKSNRPCSIFLEPSYMAYYFISYLSILWFGKEFKRKLFNIEILFIAITLVVLRSGSGLVALALLLTIKIIIVFWHSNVQKRVISLFLVLPLLIGSIIFYIDSEIGQEMFARSSEFSKENSSGFDRVVGGYLMFDSLNDQEQMFGILNYREKFGRETDDNKLFFFANGIQIILLSLGFIGLLLYLVFYINLFIKVDLLSRMSIIVLLVMSLLEYNYLNPYMMLLTIIPCADYYYHNHLRRALLIPKRK